MPERKVRSNKGVKRGPRVTKTPTKCTNSFKDGTLKLTRFGKPYLLTKAGNRYSCANEFTRKSISMANYKKPTVHEKPKAKPSQFPKGTVRNGFVVKMVKVPTGAGYRKAWRKVL